MTTLNDRSTATSAGRPPVRVTIKQSRRGPLRRWWRRRPVFRTLVIAHRWPALVLGLLLVVETTAGAILLYKPEMERLLHPGLYHRTEGPAIGFAAAMAAVERAHPDDQVTSAYTDHGMYVVPAADGVRTYYLDPATGRINGIADFQDDPLGFLVNLHDCGFTCEGYAGHWAWPGGLVWAHPARWFPAWIAALPRYYVLFGLLGLLMILLAVSSLRIWWPGWRKLKQRARVRTGKGRFVRDYDLHNLIGAVALPFILMWGVTGAAFELPKVESVWLHLTGGQSPVEESFSIAPTPGHGGEPRIGLDVAERAALDDVPGRVSSVSLPTKDAPWYEIDVISSAYGSYGAVDGADTYVLIDPHDATNLKATYSARGEPVANRFYDKYFEPAHFGEQVNGWWRLIWLGMGLAPLLLMITGVSTWLARRGVRRRKKAAKAARLAARPTAGR